MPDTLVLAALATADIVLMALAVSAFAQKGKRVGAARWLFMLLVPIAGAITLRMLAKAEGKPPADAEWMTRNAEKYRSVMALGAQASQTVPLEEALVINDPQKRRALMMNMLRSDPRKYLDILLVARFNEDQETAHYATATLLEVQHQTQLELQRLQGRIAADPQDEDAHLQYVRTLDEYCNSGLLEAQLLRHQRLVLAKALDDIQQRVQSIELLAMDVRNSLCLKEPSRARECAAAMLKMWPLDERSWLEMMRVYVETRDRQGMNELMKNAKDTNVEWTSAGYEKMKFWMSGQG